MWLSLASCRNQEDNNSSALELNNAFFDRAWNLCHRNPAGAYGDAVDRDNVPQGDRQGRSASETQSVLCDYFRCGHRHRGEDINDFIIRKSDEFERPRDMHVSHDLCASFLLEFSGGTEDQRKRIVASANNGYTLD